MLLEWEYLEQVSMGVRGDCDVTRFTPLVNTQCLVIWGMGEWELVIWGLVGQGKGLVSEGETGE